MKTRTHKGIKPCPFCGSSVTITLSSFKPLSGIGNYYIVNHNEYTQCAFVYFTITADTIQSAARKWNTRPAPGEKITKLCQYYKEQYKACFATKGGERTKCEGCRERCEL